MKIKVSEKICSYFWLHCERSECVKQKSQEQVRCIGPMHVRKIYQPNTSIFKFYFRNCHNV